MGVVTLICVAGMAISMRFSDIFYGTIALIAGFTIAVSIWDFGIDLGVAPPQLSPPSSVFEYQPTTTGLVSLGDYAWAVAQLLVWIANVPTALKTLMYMCGMPEPWPTVLLSLIMVPMAAFIIYIVSGRVIE